MSDLRSQLTVKDGSIALMVLKLELKKEESKKMRLKNRRQIALLNNDIAGLKRQAQPLRPLIPDTKFQGAYETGDGSNVYVYILGKTWTLDSLRTSQYSSSAPDIIFYWAANNGDAEAVRHIYDTTKVDGMYVDPKTNMNALQIASTQSFSCVVETLLSLGLTSGHHQALQIAVDKGHLEIVRMLHASGARLSVLPLSAVQNGYEEIVEVLVGDNIDISDPKLLECAVTNRHNEMVKALSSEDRPLRKPNNDFDHRKGFLGMASYSGDTATLQAILQDWPVQPMDILISSLYYAICTLQGPCLKVLLDYLVHKVDQGSVGINIMFREALNLAVCIGNVEMIDIMRESQYVEKLSRELTDHDDSRLKNLHEIVKSEFARQRSLVPNSKPEL